MDLTLTKEWQKYLLVLTIPIFISWANKSEPCDKAALHKAIPVN